VDGLLRHAVSLANTQLEGRFLFGGARDDARPYELTGSSGSLDFIDTSPSGDHSVEISAQQRVPTNHSGSEVFGSSTSGVLASLRDLASALESDDTGRIGTALNEVTRVFDHVQQLLVDTGVRSNHLEMTRANLDAMEHNLLALKSDLEEVDLEEAVSQLIGRQNVFQAAMLATSRVMGLTLTDYLR
jgi:flagellar hook-associated protein 3 FlgL